MVLPNLNRELVLNVVPPPAITLRVMVKRELLWAKAVPATATNKSRKSVFIRIILGEFRPLLSIPYYDPAGSSAGRAAGGVPGASAARGLSVTDGTTVSKAASPAVRPGASLPNGPGALRNAARTFSPSALNARY